ncbi:hypothetical protein TIFTF001_010616 [Ficus carica]|uniref:Uncharacterized protein n=1 Tax=Ficus carica TaxID=3494 RepID=A0AA88D4P4_FICCA|nr:hypothetical protein TIFTF001_010616 [Ficus carica]
MENAPDGNQEVVPQGRGRPPARVDYRINQLIQIIGTLESHTKGTGETTGRKSGIFGSRTRTRGSMGSKQRRAQRKAQEREAASNGGRHQGGDHDGDHPGMPPRPPRRDVIPRESALVHNKGDLWERIQAQ